MHIQIIAGSSYRFNLVTNGANEKECKGTTWAACCPFRDWLWPHWFWLFISE
jgi:hypothetical protein